MKTPGDRRPMADAHPSVLALTLALASLLDGGSITAPGTDNSPSLDVQMELSGLRCLRAATLAAARAAAPAVPLETAPHAGAVRPWHA